mmetsp:Transcript_34373/g.75248  ORF Transcript_34373/g.75248 Transcript_34373/m.75248 type:complete len:334 (-) Transcript_34373:93-1094(-)
MSKSLHRSLEAKLAALDGPEWDSSDDEENVQIVSQVNDTKKKKKGKSSSSKSTAAPAKANKGSKGTAVANKAKSSSVIYLGHLPPGFEEGEIRGFLTQFGSIRKLRLSRSKKTGNSRGYAFVEFVDPEVAEIVADTMSGYFLLEKRLVCHVVPRDKCHPSLFDGHNKRFVKIDWQGINREQVNKPRTAEGMKKITKRLVKRETAKRKKLQALGIDYDFPGYQAGVGETQGGEDGKAASGKRKRKSSKDEGAEAGFPKRRERKGSDVSTDGESSVKKSAKRKSAKKQRKTSEADLDHIAEETETPKKKSTSNRSAKTEIKKKKKSSKKRRDSVP